MALGAVLLFFVVMGIDLGAGTDSNDTPHPEGKKKVAKRFIEIH